MPIYEVFPTPLGQGNLVRRTGPAIIINQEDVPVTDGSTAGEPAATAVMDDTPAPTPPAPDADEQWLVVLPREISSGGVALAVAGLELLDPVPGAPLQSYARLPPGWQKIEDEGRCSGRLVDEQGRTRARFVYRDDNPYACEVVSMEAVARYGYRLVEEDCGVCVEVLCEGEVVHTTATLTIRGKRRKDAEARQAVILKARAWLYEHFPKWRDPSAYWD
ncbi:hypothetical protein JNJ66_01050 [Candidatus Saccharibacteria bacterium]|nr:hypothetical protein [Candidatus Saccharibacteria bacterium]